MKTIPITCGLEGIYRLTVRRPDGSVRETREFPNIITNWGLDAFGYATAEVLRCVTLGTDTTAPDATQTTLLAPGCSSTVTGHNSPPGTPGNTTGVSGSSPYYGWMRVSRRFNQGVATGTWTEIGIGETAVSNVFSRALILDGFGVPTSLTVLAIEILDVEYEVRFYAPASDVVSTIAISGVTHDYTLRACNVNAVGAWGTVGMMSTGKWAADSLAIVYTGDIGAVTEIPAGTAASVVSSTVAGL